MFSKEKMSNEDLGIVKITVPKFSDTLLKSSFNIILKSVRV